MGHGGRVNDGNGGERVGRGEEGSGADPGERRRGRGSERGEWERGPRERGPLAPLSSRGVHRRRGGSAATRPVPTRSGEQEGDAGGGGEVGWAGARLRVAAQLGPGGGRFWAAGPVGGSGPFFLCFLFLFCFLFSLICLFPFLFYFI